MGKWVCGYGFYHPIPVPALSDGYDIFPIYKPMGNILSHTRTLIGFLPGGYAGHGYPLPSLLRTDSRWFLDFFGLGTLGDLQFEASIAMAIGELDLWGFLGDKKGLEGQPR
jgi:hypothetical protein